MSFYKIMCLGAAATWMDEFQSPKQHHAPKQNYLKQKAPQCGARK